MPFVYITDKTIIFDYFCPLVYYCRLGRFNYSNLRTVVTMMLQITIYLLALINLIAIAVMIYFRRSNWALALSIIEIILVYLSTTI